MQHGNPIRDPPALPRERWVAEAFGRGIRRRRAELGLSQHTVCARAGISPRFLTNLEAGRQTPRLPVAARIAHALEITLDELLDDRA